VDKHAPIKEMTITMRPSAPWYTDKISDAKRIRRQKERKKRESKLTIDKEIYESQCKAVNDLIVLSKQTYYTNEILSHSGDQKALFGVLNKLTHKKQDIKLPSHDSLSELAEQFAEFFEDKIL